MIRVWLVAALLTGCAPASGGKLASAHVDLSWLEGCWRGEENGLVTVERWESKRDEGWTGHNQTTKGGEVVHHESLVIERNADGATLTASPKGQPQAMFDAVEVSEQKIVFQNLEHDFPQRITYSQSGDSLNARIEGREDGKERSATWSWTRSSGVDCDF